MMLVYLLLTTSLVEGAVQQLTSIDGYRNFRAENSPQVVFYYHHTGSQPFKSRTLTTFKSVAEEIDESDQTPFALLAVVNCQDEGIMDAGIDECNRQKRTVVAYNGDIAAPVSLKLLFEPHSFVANILLFIHAKEIDVVKTVDEWERSMMKAKGKQNLILQYFTALGDQSHFAYMSFIHNNVGDYHYLYTTELKLATALGLNEGHLAATWHAACLKMEEGSCFVTKQSNPSSFTYSNLEIFVRTQGKPLTSEINEDGSSIYGGITNIVYIIVDSSVNEPTSLIENTESILQALSGIAVNVRGVVVDRQKTSSLMESFGVYETTMLPTLMLEMVTDKHSNERELDRFPVDTDLTVEKIFDFLQAYVTNSEFAISEEAAQTNIEKFTESSWMDREKEFSNRKLLIAKCVTGKDKCVLFATAYRRLVRSMFINDVVDVEYIYVDATDSLNHEEVPQLFVRVNGQEKQYKGEFTYTNLLKFANEQFGLSIGAVPHSRSDFVGLAHQENNIEEFNEDEDDLARLQEDELAKYSHDLRNKHMYLDSVQKLTDLNFQQTLDKHVFSLVFFYVDWDEKSYLFQPAYETVKKNFESLTSLKVAKVDCSSEFTTCKSLLVHTYPTIRFFKNNEALIDYKGLLDAGSLEKNINMYMQPYYHDLDESNVMQFTKGEHPTLASKYTSVSILAWFPSQNQDLELYKQFAKNNFGRALFGFVVGEAYTQMLSVPVDSLAFVKSFKHNDAMQPSIEFKCTYTEEQLQEFLLLSTIPLFGELTATTFPTYKAVGKPFLLIMNDKSTPSSLFNSLRGIVAENNLPYVTPVSLDTELALSRKIRTHYIGGKKHSDGDLVLVNYTQGEVYHFKRPEKEEEEYKDSIKQWVEECRSGNVAPASYLSRHEWKPLREGFDYLKMIREGEEHHPIDQATRGRGHNKPPSFPKNDDGSPSQQGLDESLEAGADDMFVKKESMSSKVAHDEF